MSCKVNLELGMRVVGLVNGSKQGLQALTSRDSVPEEKTAMKKKRKP